MGMYFADIFKNAGYKVLISDKKTKLTNQKLAAGSDVVIVSVPIDKTEKIIQEIVHKVKEDAVLMDLTSLKEFPIKEMLKGKSEVIGLHPMFGHTNPLPGQTIIACPVRSKKWFPWIKKFLTDQGASVTILDPKEHDKIMATVQALVHFADIAFGHALKELKMPVKKYLKYASPASELKIAFVGRLLAQDPDLYANIQIHNPQAKKVLTQYLKSINKLITINEKHSSAAYKKYFNDAGKFLAGYKQQAFNDTNYLIHAILERRKRHAIPKQKKSSKTVDIAVLGPKNTFSDIAAQKYIENLKEKPKIAYAGSINEIFEMVEKKQAKLGIVPVENLLNGTIRETFDELFEKNVHAVSKFDLDIKYACVALPEVKKPDIDTIASHAQALGQCKEYLKRNYPHAKLLGTPSTIAAFEKLLGENDRHTAVIIPEQAAGDLNCNILSKNIGDNAKNRTTFNVIKKGNISVSGKKPAKGGCETSIAFYFDADKPGSLLKIFQDFAGEKINLTRIESRPSRKKLGNYVFFLDFEEHLYSPKAQRVLKKIQKKVVKLKILGTYPSVSSTPSTM